MHNACMTEVTWLGKDGGLVESVVAVMLSRRYHRAVCIRPSVGDGGIDIQVPTRRGLELSVRAPTRSAELGVGGVGGFLGGRLAAAPVRNENVLASADIALVSQRD